MIMNKTVPADRANQTFRRLEEVHLSFYFYSWNRDEMSSTVSADARTDSVQTSISSLFSVDITFSTFRT